MDLIRLIEAKLEILLRRFKKEDYAHTSGDYGLMLLAVRNDGGTVLVGDNGDYIPLTTDSSGSVYTNVSNIVNVSGDVAHDSPDSGNPVKIGGKASTSEPTAVTNADRVNAYFDANGYLHNKNHSHLSGDTTLTDINITYDDSPTSANSADITCSGYRWARFATTIDSANTPTDIRFIIQSKIGSNYFDRRNGYLASFIFEDTEVATAQNYSFIFPVVGEDTIRIRVVCTGTTAANTFTLTNSTIQLGT